MSMKSKPWNECDAGKQKQQHAAHDVAPNHRRLGRTEREQAAYEPMGLMATARAAQRCSGSPKRYFFGIGMSAFGASFFGMSIFDTVIVSPFNSPVRSTVCPACITSALSF